MTNQKNALKDWYESLTIAEATSQKNLIRQKMNWTRHQWHSRITGKVKLKASEQIAITQIIKTNIF